MKRRLSTLVLAAGLIVVIGAGAGILSARSGDTHSSGAGHSTPGPAGPLELAAVSPGIADHYRYAEVHEHEYSRIPCFCGCESFLDHRHLYDCFVRGDGAGYDAHAAGCGVCIGESAVARRLIDEQKALPQVRAAVVAQFGATPGTAPNPAMFSADPRSPK